MNSKIDSISTNLKPCAFPNCDFIGEKGLFQIPNDHRREKWLEVSNLKESDITNKTKFCFKHFNPNEIQGGEKFKRLKAWAIPNSNQQEAKSFPKTFQVNTSNLHFS